MCGIAGIVSFKASEPFSAKSLYMAVRRMRHRGPDDEGYFLENDEFSKQCIGGDTPYSLAEFSNTYHPPVDSVEQNLNCQLRVGFGHRRLSIIDLSIKGHQPLADSTGRYWIVFNGEIYNYKEVRASLINQGHSFVSNSDTEVILHAYMQYGKNCVSLFRGMFAFAVYDRAEREVYIARDRVGIKPVFYTVQNGRFIFASDVKAIIATGLYSPSVNWNNMYHLFSFGVSLSPGSAFEGIHSVKPGHYLTISEQGTITETEYWDIPVGTINYNLTEKQAAEFIEEQLVDAVSSCLVSDVEIGTFMSGGVDSTLVTSIANNLSAGIKAFTLCFEDAYANGFNEFSQAKATAKMNNIDHIVKMVHVNDVLNNLQKMVELYEEPFYSVSPNYVISQFVQENNIRVVLNGLGGDELFAGYNFYSDVRLWKMLKNFHPLLQLLPTGGKNAFVNYAKSVIASQDIPSFYSAQRTPFSKKEKDDLFSGKIPVGLSSGSHLKSLYNLDSKSFADPIEFLSYLDMKTYVGGHHTYRSDQFTMNFSVEGRFPMLDHKFIEAAATIPGKYKLKGKAHKHLLKQIAVKYIAPSSISMKKKGFSFPLVYWVNHELKDLTSTNLQLLKQRGVLNLKKPEAYTASQSWFLVMFELWMQQFIDP